MIESFKCSETETVWNQSKSKKWPLAVQKIGLRKLFMLNRAGELNDLRVPPANRLEKLKGTRAGEFSIRINDQWRICFRWENGGVFDVEIVDYH